MFNKAIKTLALGSALLLSANASASFLTTEDDLVIGFNASGTGTSGYILNVDAITYEGWAYTSSVTDPVTGLPVTFENYGYLSVNSFTYGSDTTNTIVEQESIPIGLTPEYIAAATQDSLALSLTATYNDWTGTFTDYDPADDDNVEFTIDSGTIDWFVDGSLVMTTSIVAVSDGALDLSGDTQNGTVNLKLEVTYALEDYFYIDLDENGTFEDGEGVDGVYSEDFADLICDYVSDPDCTPVYLAYAQSNNTIEQQPDDVLLDILASSISLYWDNLTDDQQTYLATTYDIDLDPDNWTQDEIDTLTNDLFDYLSQETVSPFSGNTIPTSFFTRSNGDLTASPIPEPGMLGLMGLALFGLAGFQRRRKS